MGIQSDILDKRAINFLKKDSNTAFCYIYNKYYNKMNLFAYHIVMTEESHDIVNDIFTKLWENRRNIFIEISLSSYLYSAVRNSCLNYLKHHKIADDNQDKVIEALLFIHDNSNNDGDNLQFTKEDIAHLIDKLPSQQKKIINLRLQGKSYEEISKLLGISSKTINTHLYRAYNFIRTNMLIVSILVLMIIKINIFCKYFLE